jgi:hypothetical protein
MDYGGKLPLFLRSIPVQMTINKRSKAVASRRTP